jgi:hypothetical protein
VSGQLPPRGPEGSRPRGFGPPPRGCTWRERTDPDTVWTACEVLRQAGPDAYRPFIGLAAPGRKVSQRQFEILLAVSEGFVHATELAPSVHLPLVEVEWLLDTMRTRKLLADDDRRSDEFGTERPVRLRQAGCQTIVSTMDLLNLAADRRLRPTKQVTNLKFDEVLSEHLLLASRSRAGLETVAPELAAALDHQQGDRVVLDRSVAEGIQAELAVAAMQGALASRAVGLLAGALQRTRGARLRPRLQVMLGGREQPSPPAAHDNAG